ncbi:MAG TPA: hypothetical protein VKE22_25080 [Haliangiales bacterium]|nr:hypothetical protein [Haliangiales bacterium]
MRHVPSRALSLVLCMGLLASAAPAALACPDAAATAANACCCDPPSDAAASDAPVRIERSCCCVSGAPRELPAPTRVKSATPPRDGDSLAFHPPVASPAAPPRPVAAPAFDLRRASGPPFPPTLLGHRTAFLC